MSITASPITPATSTRSSSRGLGRDSADAAQPTAITISEDRSTPRA
jgi:hypothetical protein